MRQLLAACIFGLLASPVMACGEAEAPCEISSGTYRIHMPDGPTKGTVVFLHGHGSSADGTMKNTSLVDDVLARGYAFVAAEGMPRANGQGRAWSFRPDRRGRDETAYFTELFDMLASRHALDRNRILLGGFSSGGFMTSYLACAEPQIVRAFAPVSGGFWRPDPESCAGPVKLFHTHGWTDTVVPLEGRYLGGAGAAQADIFHGLEIWRDTNDCARMLPDTTSTEGPFWRRSWTSCTPGSSLEFALFPGGHFVPQGWADMVLTWFEALPDTNPHRGE